MIDLAAVLLVLLIPLGPPAFALMVLPFGPPRARSVAAWCLAGFGAGVGAAVVVTLVYAWMPGIKHSSPRMALPETVGFALMAVVCFPVVGSLVGAVAGGFGPERRRGLGRGAALGLALGIGVTILAPGLRAGGHEIGADALAGLCFNGALGLPVVGAVLGAVLAWPPQEKTASDAGAACRYGALWGLGAGVLAGLVTVASLLEARVVGGDVVSGRGMVTAQVVAGVFVLIGFTAAGAVLRAWPWLGPRSRWAWSAALGVFLFWGPVYRTTVARPAFRASEVAPYQRIIKDEKMAIGTDGRGDVLFRYAFANRGRSNPVRSPIGQDRDVFKMYDGPGPLGLAADITWPAPGVFALTMKFVPGPRNQLTVDLEEGFDDVSATSDGAPVVLPVEVLPVEGRVLVIKARCPRTATKAAPSGFIESPGPGETPFAAPTAPAPPPASPASAPGYDADLELPPGPDTIPPLVVGRIVIRPFTDYDRPEPDADGVWLTNDRAMRVHGEKGIVLDRETRGEGKRSGESGDVLVRSAIIGGFSARLDWTEPRAYELTVDLDSEDRKRLTVRLAEGFEGVSATLDGAPVEPPVKMLAPGKSHLVIKARCPATPATSLPR